MTTTRAAGFGPRRVVIAAVVLAGLVVAAVVLTRSSGSSSSPTTAGRVAPAVSAVDVRDGRPPVDLTAIRAGRPAVVNFFAAWCEPCRQELPALARASAAHPGVAFVGVDYQDSKSNAVDILDRYGVGYPAAYDPEGGIGATYGIRGLPATAFVDARGRITAMHLGALSASELERRLSRLVPAG